MELENEKKFKIVSEASAKIQELYLKKHEVVPKENNILLDNINMFPFEQKKSADKENPHPNLTNVPFFDIIYDNLFKDSKKTKTFDIKNVHFYGLSKGKEKKKEKNDKKGRYVTNHKCAFLLRNFNKKKMLQNRYNQIFILN